MLLAYYYNQTSQHHPSWMQQHPGLIVALIVTAALITFGVWAVRRVS